MAVRVVEFSNGGYKIYKPRVIMARVRYIDYTKVHIPLLGSFRKSSSPLVLVSSLDFRGFQFPRSFYSPN